MIGYYLYGKPQKRKTNHTDGNQDLFLLPQKHLALRQKVAKGLFLI